MERYPIEVTEKRTVKRVTVRQSFADFLDAFNVERGLVFTVKLLLVKPGKLIRFYLNEGRFKIVNAFRLLIITTAVSLVLLSFTNSFEQFYSVQGDSLEQTEELSQYMNTLFTDWYNLILWLSIPCYALASWLLLKKFERFNYAEHLVIQTFFISLNNLIVIAFIPFGFLIGWQEVFAISLVFGFIYYIFLFLDIFRQRNFWFFFRVFMAFVIGNLFYMIMISIGLSLMMLRYLS